MTTTNYSTSPNTRTRSAGFIGAASAVIASALAAYVAHDWTETAVIVPLVVVVAAIVFGTVVPRALRKESAGGTALGLSIPAALLLLPAFWAGLPLVLGVAGLLVGNAGRTGRTGAGKCMAAVVLGALVVLGYFTVYTLDAVAAG